MWRSCRGTYTQAVLESLATDGQGLEQLGNRFCICLRIARSACGRTLGRGEVGDALGGLDRDVGPSHDGNGQEENLDKTKVN